MTTNPGPIPLGPPVTFDARIFTDEDKSSQRVCNLVLALAVANNDLRDIWNAQVEIIERAKTPANQDPFAKANLGGQGIASMRCLSGMLNELFILLADEEGKAIAHELFAGTLGRLDKKSRQAWDDVCATAAGRRTSDELANVFAKVRDKVSFHYESARISQGFQRRFLGDGSHAGPPVIAMGNSMASQRFYFGDAALESYLAECGLEPRSPELFKLVDAINLALKAVVHAFIAERGGKLAPYSLEDKQP